MTTLETKVRQILSGMDFLHVNVPGVEGAVKCVNITQLAKLCGRKPGSLRTLEKKGKFPPAPYRYPGRVTSTGINTSYRIYPVDAAVKIAVYFRENITQGAEITPEQTAQMARYLK